MALGLRTAVYDALSVIGSTTQPGKRRLNERFQTPGRPQSLEFPQEQPPKPRITSWDQPELAPHGSAQLVDVLLPGLGRPRVEDVENLPLDGLFAAGQQMAYGLALRLGRPLRAIST